MILSTYLSDNNIYSIQLTKRLPAMSDDKPNMDMNEDVCIVYEEASLATKSQPELIEIVLRMQTEQNKLQAELDKNFNTLKEIAA